MNSLQNLGAKVCLTAAGCLIHDEKVLLIKHKKLGIWLNPGGHIEENELPHQAAEREFWEETGVKVVAYDPMMPQKAVDGSEYVPNPILTNLHWVSKENYEHRVHGKKLSAETAKHWKKGCEQHVNFLYLLRPATDDVNFKENIEETDGIAWFAQDELDDKGVIFNIKLEIKRAFKVAST